MSTHLTFAVMQRDFYPRPPRGGRPPDTGLGDGHKLYFYPRPPRGGRRTRHNNKRRKNSISIHALREEGDLHQVAAILEPLISIHALREEGDG